MLLIEGTFVHTPGLGGLETFTNHLLATNDNGTITHFGSADSPESLQLLSRSEHVPKVVIPQGSFLLPTFCDLHLHAPQFMYQGTGLDLPLMQWLDMYALKAEASLDANPALAKKVYERLAFRLKENGTGTVLLFGTIKEETNIILAECMQSAGLRAFVGKLSMDIDITTPSESPLPKYTEGSPAASLAAARSFIGRCQSMVSHLPKEKHLVEPVLTPRFVPTCSDELLAGLGGIAREGGIKIQSHMCEAKDQVEWVERERGINDMQVFEKHSLLTPHTTQAHCTYLPSPLPASLTKLAASGTSIAHCPLSNAYFSGLPFPLREALEGGVKVGLGTDVAGGYSIDMMNAMRMAVSVSRMREGELKEREGGRCGSGLAIDWKESLFLATRGGSLALGLEGMFKVGAGLDAQEVRLFDPQCRRGVGGLDFFEIEGQRSPDITPEMVEKWWCIGDTRNRSRMWIQGDLVVT